MECLSVRPTLALAFKPFLANPGERASVKAWAGVGKWFSHAAAETRAYLACAYVARAYLANS